MPNQLHGDLSGRAARIHTVRFGTTQFNGGNQQAGQLLFLIEPGTRHAPGSKDRQGRSRIVCYLSVGPEAPFIL